MTAESARSDARSAHREMGMPSATDVNHFCAIGKATMDQDEANLIVLRRKLEANLRQIYLAMRKSHRRPSVPTVCNCSAKNSYA